MTILSEAKALIDGILEDFDDLCNELNIRYCLINGVCLGFYRDGGYIPWDDDIDVWIDCGPDEEEKFQVMVGRLREIGLGCLSDYHRFCRDNTWLDIFRGDYRDGFMSFVESFDTVVYNNRVYNLPRPIEKYLEYVYGEDWRIPKSGSGRHRYRWKVGPPQNYDIMGAMQFNLLTYLGLRDNHYLLDIGCGSLRAGRLFIPYLNLGHYYAIEPYQELIDWGIEYEVGKSLIEAKKPVFSNDNGFNLTAFDRRFEFLLAQSIFSHAAKWQIVKCLSEATKVMWPSSIFAASFICGEQDYQGDEFSLTECIKYRLSTIIELGKSQGLLCRQINWFHPHGQTWVLFMFPEAQEYLSSELFDLGKPKLGRLGRVAERESRVRWY